MLEAFLTHEFWLSLEYLPIAEQIGATWWFPLINSLHVLAISFMLGALLMLDLRIAGLAATRYSVDDLAKDFLPWIWFSFVIACLTGTGLFITRASAHMLNPAFQWKMLLMVIAAANMMMFHWLSLRHRRSQQPSVNVPALLKWSAVLSLIIWAGVMLAGRWVGHIV
ncbi:hypothetical protein E3V39_08635 [Gammaproteobacteria bacterium LSUCC0112]|nr:hypothetical protein E3V39_08635 [Gammaproteobacteria bacterium LSUCC0112]